jgi:hypothetical protein
MNNQYTAEIACFELLLRDLRDGTAHKCRCPIFYTPDVQSRAINSASRLGYHVEGVTPLPTVIRRIDMDALYDGAYEPAAALDDHASPTEQLREDPTPQMTVNPKFEEIIASVDAGLKRNTAGENDASEIANEQPILTNDAPLEPETPDAHEDMTLTELLIREAEQADAPGRGMEQQTVPPAPEPIDPAKKAPKKKGDGWPPPRIYTAACGGRRHQKDCRRHEREAH